MPIVQAPENLREAPEVSVVLPVFNEQENLEQLDRELREVLRATGQRCEIIYVDDFSTDGSPELLRGRPGRVRHRRRVDLRRLAGRPRPR